jgi:hypothetical protein
MCTKPPTPRDMLILEPITHHQKKSPGLLLDHRLMIQKKMRNEHVWMKLKVGEEKSLRQQLHKVAFRKNLNPT